METQPQARLFDETTIDIRKHLRTFWKYKWVFGLVFAAVAAAILYATMSAPKVYEAATTVQINPRTPKVLYEIREVIELGTGSYWANREFLTTQYQVIGSRAVAQRVVEREGLDRDPDFLGLAKIRDPDQLAKATKEVDAVEILAGGITVGPVEGSHLAQIRVQDFKPERAIRLSVSVAEAYRDINLELKVSETRKALKTLKGQKDDLKAALVRSEQKLIEFKRQNGVLTVSLQDRLNVVAQDLLTFNAALAKAESEVVALHANLEQTEKLDPIAVAVEEQRLISTNRVAGYLMEARESLRQQLTEHLTRYQEQHPKVVPLQKRMDLLDRALEAENRAIKARARIKFQAELNKLRRKVHSGERTFEGLKKLVTRADARAKQLSAKELEYRQLERDVTENRQMYKLVSKRLKEVDLEKDIQYNNVSILDGARRAKLVRPRLMYSLFFALGLGSLAGLALVVLINYLDRTVKSQEDIEQVLGLTFLGVVPTVRGDDGNKVADPELWVHTHPKSSVAELCRSVRTNIQFMSPDRKMTKLLVTSAAPLEGKTLVTLSLGISMAQTGNRVVLVSSDMRRPRLQSALGVRGAKGISDWIMGDAEIDEILRPTPVANLTLLPCGPIPPNPAEILHAERFHKLVEELERRFDRVLFDSPPMGAVTDPLILGALVDGVIVVVRAGLTTKDMVKHAYKKLRTVNAHVLGCVLNNLDLKADGYGYYYYRKGYYYTSDAEDPATRTG